MKRERRWTKGKRHADGRHDRRVLLAQAKDMLPSIDTRFVRLGQVLVDLKEECDDNEQFKEMCETLNISYRKAAYLISVYATAKDLGIPSDDLSEIGWTKASIIAPVLRPSNWKGWVSRARKVNTVTLKEMVATGSQDTRKLMMLPVKETTQRVFMKALQELGARQGDRKDRWKNLDTVLMKMVRAVRDKG